MGEWTSALAVGEWSASRPGRFTPGERAPGTHWSGGPQACLNDMEKRKFLTLPGLELRSYAINAPPSTAEVKKKWIYTSTPLIRLHDVALNEVSRGTILPFTFK
jgi:hypothetical protein